MIVTVRRQAGKSPTIKSRFGPILAVMGLSLSMVSGLGEEHYRVDAASSEVDFSLGAWDGPVKGAFRVTSGEFTLDATSGAMTGTVNVDATSGRSGNDRRDNDMRSKQLKAQTYSTISFSPTKFSGQVKDSGDSAGQVEGNFTLLGQSHAITVPMTVHMEGDRFTATGSFTIPYVRWGVKDPSWLVMKVDKEVKIELKLIGSVTR